MVSICFFTSYACVLVALIFFAYPVEGRTDFKKPKPSRTASFTSRTTGSIATTTTPTASPGSTPVSYYLFSTRTSGDLFVTNTEGFYTRR